MSGGYGPRVPENATHGQGPFLIQVLGVGRLIKSQRGCY